MSRSDYSKAMHYVGRLLSQRAYTRRDIEERLLKRATPPKITQEVLDRLETLELINDQQWLEGYVRSRVRKRWGPQRILATLRAKGFSSEQVLPLLEDCEQKNAIEELLRTRYRNRNLNDFRERNKVAQALLRRGFDSQEVFSALGTH